MLKMVVTMKQSMYIRNATSYRRTNERTNNSTQCRGSSGR